MAKYINLTKRPVPVSPSVGEPFIIPPKGTAILTPEQESSSSIVSLLSKGTLKRIADVIDPVPVPVIEAALPKVSEALPVEIEEKEEEKPVKKVSPDKGIKKSL